MDQHPFFNRTNWWALTMCGLVLALATGFLSFQNVTGPTENELRPWTFRGPIPVFENTVSVRGVEIRELVIQIPGGPEVAYPCCRPRYDELARLLSRPVAMTAFVFSDATRNELWALAHEGGSGLVFDIAREEVAEFEASLLPSTLGFVFVGASLVVLMLIFRQRFWR
jgi:hypothetical protein